jgi:hypothetical protein
MLDLKNISLLCIETRNPKLAIHAIEKSRSNASFGECILLTTKKLHVPENVSQIEIDEITSIEDYSKFMIREVHKYFNREHVLIIQWDGFVLSPAAWKDEFLEYDYLGAPWEKRGFVGNGGFSLRSKKLCQALASIEVKRYHPEDLVICEDLRQNLEKNHGMKFGGIEVAKYFSYESVRPNHQTFGFHAINNFPTVFSDKEVLDIVKLGDESFLLSGHVTKLIRSAYKMHRFDLSLSVLNLRSKSVNSKKLENKIIFCRIIFKILLFKFSSGFRAMLGRLS